MSRFLHIAFLIPLLVCLSLSAPSAAAVSVGDPAPNFFVKNIQDGSFFQLSDFSGEVVILVFFADD